MEANLINFIGLFINGLIFFIGNLLSQIMSKNKSYNEADYFQANNAAFVGIIIAFAFFLLNEIDYVSEIAVFTGLILSGFTLLSLFSGLFSLMISRDSARFINSIRILAGLFNSNTYESALSNNIQLLSRFTWELPQTLLGYIFVQVMNCIGRVGEVRLIAGASFCLHYQNSSHRQGVSIGNFIYVKILPGNIRFENDPLLLHEYGHNLQSRRWGLLYLFVIGIPSLISAITARPLPGGVTTHDLKWYELQANRFAAAYLKNHFGTDWTQFEPPFNSFPRFKFRNIT